MLPLTAMRNDVTPDISWQVAVRMRDGAVGTADLTVNEHGGGGEGIHLRCEKGTLELRTFIPFTNRASEVAVFRDSTEQVAGPGLGYANPYELQLRSFLAASKAHRSGADPIQASIAAGVGVPATVEDGLAVMRILDAVTRSAAADGAKVSP